MTRKIIQVVPSEKYFSLSWLVGTRCNYDCMYCSPKWHDDHSKPHSLEQMQQAWIGIWEKTKHHDLPYKISFSGGELTTNKHFLPFVKWLRQNFDQYLFKLMLSTNGSATFSYYQKMFHVIDNITFSVHSEHIDETRFFDMIIKLKSNMLQSRFLQVAIMNEFWNKDRIPIYTALLDRYQISYTVNQIDYTYQTRVVPVMKGNLNLNV